MHTDTETDTGTDLQGNLQLGTDSDSNNRGRMEVMGSRTQKTQSWGLSLVKRLHQGSTFISVLNATPMHYW